MKIAKFPSDPEGLIYVKDIVRLLTMGIQDNVVTVWAVVDPMKTGVNMTFVVKKDGASVDVKDCKSYITSFINDQGCWHLFNEPAQVKPSILQPPRDGFPPSPSNPKGRLLT